MIENMDISAIILAIIGFLSGSGGAWWLTTKALRRKANGEATQTEADGWKSMQDVYQQTISDIKSYCDDIRQERDKIIEEKNTLRKENESLLKKLNEFGEQILDLKEKVARQGRQIEAIRPFVCGFVACMNRTKVEIDEPTLNPQEEQEEKK